MAVLTSAQRQEEWASFMHEASKRHDELPLDKAELRSFFDAIDDWIIAKQPEFNLALPMPARTALTTPQKAEGLLFVVRRRYLEGI